MENIEKNISNEGLKRDKVLRRYANAINGQADHNWRRVTPDMAPERYEEIRRRNDSEIQSAKENCLKLGITDDEMQRYINSQKI